MSIDWNKVIKETDEGTKVIPPGEYNVRVSDAIAVKAGSGADMIKTTVKLTDPPYEGRSIVTNLVFTFDNPIAMRMLFRRLGALGITSEWLAETSATIQQIAEAIRGRSTIAKLNVRTWQNEDRNDVEMFIGEAGMGGRVAGGPDLETPPPPTLDGLGPVSAPSAPASAPPAPTGPEPF